MNWCLDCHRNPEKYVRPRDQVFNMNWERPSDDPDLGSRLVTEYKIGTSGSSRAARRVTGELSALSFQLSAKTTESTELEVVRETERDR